MPRQHGRGGVRPLPYAHRMADAPPLTLRDLAILDIEDTPWQHAGVKEQAIRDRLDLSATSYYQLLNLLIEDERALAHSPVVVNRLLRLRDERLKGVAR